MQYIGVGVQPSSSDGWHYPSFADTLADRPDPQDVSMMQALMNIDLVTPSMSEFLHG
jgi:hypothetical protein